MLKIAVLDKDVYKRQENRRVPHGELSDGAEQICDGHIGNQRYKAGRAEK